MRLVRILENVRLSEQSLVGSLRSEIVLSVKTSPEPDSWVAKLQKGQLSSFKNKAFCIMRNLLIVSFRVVM